MSVGIYLAGAMRCTPTAEKCDRTWRDIVAKDMKWYSPSVVVYNPMDGKNLFGKFQPELNSTLQMDVASILRSDIVFMNLLSLVPGGCYPHIGTLAELGISIASHKLLIVIAHNPAVVEHPFIRAAATRILPTLEDGVDYLQGLVGVLLGSEIKL